MSKIQWDLLEQEERITPSLIDVPCFHNRNEQNLIRLFERIVKWLYSILSIEIWFNKSMWFVIESHSHSYLNVKYNIKTNTELF